MTTSPWLSADEVAELTARRKWKAQCRALATMGIGFRVNAVGRPLVERAAVLTAGRAKVSGRPTEPDWSKVA
jgi:hypothetical protein